MKYTVFPAIALVVLVGLVSCTSVPQQDRGDRAAVEDTVKRLFIATDDLAWSDLEAIFAEEVLFDMSSLGGGPAAEIPKQEIVAAWRQGLTPLDSVHHQLGNMLTEIDGDQASVFVYGTATHYVASAAPNDTRSFVGSYDIGLSRSGEQWVVTQFRFNSKYVTGNMELEEE